MSGRKNYKFLLMANTQYKIISSSALVFPSFKTYQVFKEDRCLLLGSSPTNSDLCKSKPGTRYNFSWLSNCSSSSTSAKSYHPPSPSWLPWRAYITQLDHDLEHIQVPRHMDCIPWMKAIEYLSDSECNHSQWNSLVPRTGIINC